MRSFLCMLVAWAILWAGPALASSAPDAAAATTDPGEAAGTAQAPPEEALPAGEGLIAWAAYWDITRAMEELELSTRRLSTLVYFAAYFDANDALFVPDQVGLLMNYMATLPGPLPEEYLSFTNDRLTADGGSLLKDTKILWMILSNPDQRGAHIDEIIATTQSMGLSAVEIDYEGFRNDIPLLRFFMTFVDELYAKTSALGMPLRVVLEPSVPFDALDFPSGP
ncbi:MAG TPA: hypothetical protein PKE04_01140, partial [Clostridia bacterium]|nr:hypothetical protein [Clostridia bacterium]